METNNGRNKEPHAINLQNINIMKQSVSDISQLTLSIVHINVRIHVAGNIVDSHVKKIQQ